MKSEIKSDDIIFNFFKQICDEKDDVKCVELGKSWIQAMETNIENIESNLEETDKIKYNEGIKKNKEHLKDLRNNNSSEWRDYATKCMIEIMENKNNNKNENQR